MGTDWWKFFLPGLWCQRKRSQMWRRLWREEEEWNLLTCWRKTLILCRVKVLMFRRQNFMSRHYTHVKWYQCWKSKGMPFPFCSSLVLETKMSQSFLQQKSSLFISRETNRQENIVVSEPGFHFHKYKTIEDKRGSEVLSFVCVKFCQSLPPNKALAYFFILFLSWDENIYFRFPHTSFYGGKVLAWISDMLNCEST